MTEDIIERSLKLNRNSMKSIILRSAIAMVLFAVLGIVLKFYNPLNSVSRYLSLASAVSLMIMVFGIFRRRKILDPADSRKAIRENFSRFSPREMQALESDYQNARSYADGRLRIGERICAWISEERCGIALFEDVQGVHFNDDPEENKTVYYVSLHLMGEAGEVDIPMGRRAYRRMSEDMRGRYPYLII